jgi:uncharacterized OB-fold protein
MSLHLTVYHCHQCGLRSIIAPAYCSLCRGKESYIPVEVLGKGRIISYTTVHICEERLQKEAPYRLAIIESEGGLRLMGRLEKSETDVKIGSTVELIDWRDGAPIFVCRN